MFSWQKGYKQSRLRIQAAFPWYTSGCHFECHSALGTIYVLVLVFQSHVTIAGQTAPGGKICLRGYRLGFASCSNIIVRYKHSRLGDDTRVDADAVSITGSSNIIATGYGSDVVSTNNNAEDVLPTSQFKVRYNRLTANAVISYTLRDAGVGPKLVQFQRKIADFV